MQFFKIMECCDKGGGWKQKTATMKYSLVCSVLMEQIKKTGGESLWTG